MAKISCTFALFMAFLIVMNGTISSSIRGIEARREKRDCGKTLTRNHRKINCSSDDYCNPFAPKINLGCKNSGSCQDRCNQFGGVFLCSDHSGYCKCDMET
ncbi:Nucleoside-triphosphatase 2 [Bienertia sinuspersici]